MQPHNRQLHIVGDWGVLEVPMHKLGNYLIINCRNKLLTEKTKIKPKQINTQYLFFKG